MFKTTQIESVNEQIYENAVLVNSPDEKIQFALDGVSFIPKGTLEVRDLGYCMSVSFLCDDFPVYVEACAVHINENGDSLTITACEEELGEWAFVIERNR